MGGFSLPKKESRQCRKLGIAYVQIIPSLKGAAEQIRKALGDDTAVFKKTGQSGATAVTGALAASLGTAFAKGFNRVNAIDQAKAKLQGLGASAETVDQVMKNALASVKGTAFGLDAQQPLPRAPWPLASNQAKS